MAETMPELKIIGNPGHVDGDGEGGSADVDLKLTPFDHGGSVAELHLYASHVEHVNGEINGMATELTALDCVALASRLLEIAAPELAQRPAWRDGAVVMAAYDEPGSEHTLEDGSTVRVVTTDA